MPPTRTSTRTASSSGKAEGSSSTRAAAAGQKRTRSADDKTSSSKALSPSASKKQKDNAAPSVSTTQPKSILKKTTAPTKTAKAASSTSKAPAATKAKSAATTSAAKAPAKKASSKSPLTSKKPVAVSQVDEEDSDEEDEGLDSDEEAEMLKGMSSDSEAQDDEEEDEANSSDEDDDDADEQAMKRHSKIEVSKLSSSKDDAAVQARLDSVEKKRNASQAKDTPSAVLYVGRLPRHFTEGPLRQYFSQFGTITRLRLSRNKKTGASKHYAFLEFADEEVARIVQETMDGYLILAQILRVKLLEKEKIHPKLWIGANRAFRKVPRARIARAEHDGPKTVEQKQRAERKLLERQDKKKKDLKERGIDYEYEGYKATA